jgi:carboxylesterase
MSQRSTSRWNGLTRWLRRNGRERGGDLVVSASDRVDSSGAWPTPAEPIPPNVKPFREPGRRLGCLLVHGLTSTPEAMRPLATALAQQGVDVDAILLPGHGRRPEDLINVPWSAWDEAVRQGLERMRARCDRVFLCGQSLGGSLALHAAAHERVDGIITLAAIAYLRDWRLWFLPLITPTLRWRQSPENDIARPGVRDVGSYDRMPLTAVQQLRELAREVRSDLPNIEAPVLIVQSLEDHVVPSENADYIYEHIGSEKKELLRLHRSYHVISLDHDVELVIDRILQFIRKLGYTEAVPS